jgi:hypothetical protein
VSKKISFLCILFLVAPTHSAELRDPTQPGNLPHAQNQPTLAPGEMALKLNAIMISNHARHAIINGDLVNTGQHLADGSVVIKIQAHSVIIRQNGVNKKINLVPSVKQPVK